jgi:hypothetical protein
VRNKARVIQVNKFNRDPALFPVTHSEHEWAGIITFFIKKPIVSALSGKIKTPALEVIASAGNENGYLKISLTLSRWNSNRQGGQNVYDYDQIP